MAKRLSQNLQILLTNLHMKGQTKRILVISSKRTCKWRITSGIIIIIIIIIIIT